MEKQEYNSLVTLFAGILLVALFGLGFYVRDTTPESEGALPVPSSWATSTDSALLLTFRYPETFGTTYITPVDWPPKLEAISETFTCTQGGEVGARAGITEEKKVRGNRYCVTTIQEGAAGSIYTQYAYAFDRDDQTMILAFTTRAPQCANYNDPEKTACKTERATFNLDNLVDQIARTVVSGTSEENVESGIEGVVMLGPTCPVVSDPPDPECADRPYATNLVLTTADGAQVLKNFSSDQTGRFRVTIPPGTYAVRSAATANILPYCSTPEVVVRSNAYTAVEISCDTGIR